MPGSPSFTTKQIDLTFQLGTGNSGAAGQNLLKVPVLRILAQLLQILNQGGTRGATQIILRIYGLTLSVMNTLTNTGLGFGVRFNYVMVEAGDVNGMSMVFRGLIQEAFPDLSQMPDGASIVHRRPRPRTWPSNPSRRTRSRAPPTSPRSCRP